MNRHDCGLRLRDSRQHHANYGDWDSISHHPMLIMSDGSACYLFLLSFSYFVASGIYFKITHSNFFDKYLRPISIIVFKFDQILYNKILIFMISNKYIRSFIYLHSMSIWCYKSLLSFL